VELEKRVIKSREVPGTAPVSDSQDSSGNSKGPDKVAKGQGKNEKDEPMAGESNGTGMVIGSKWPGAKRWESVQVALQGVPENEITEH
jgi:hypothetical protein